MLTAVVISHIDSAFEVHLIAQDEGDEEATEATEEDEGPSPIAPELKELAWGAGAFLVFLVVMRLFLFPLVKQGMRARYGKITSDHEEAEKLTASAKGDVEEYERALAEVRSEAVGRVDTARKTLEGERSARLEEVNGRIAERRAQASAEIEAAREAARESIESAVADVAARATELATGRRPSDDEVRRAVDDVASVGARR